MSGEFAPAGSGGIPGRDRPLYLRDGSTGEQGQKGELGNYKGLVVGIVVEVNADTGAVIRTRNGWLQPRNWHESEAEEAPNPDFPKLKDRRYSVALIADHEDGFGTIVYPNDRANPFLSDWKFAQKSTRIIDGNDPKGNVALFAQMCKVIDDMNGQFTAAWPFKRTSGTEDDPIATGYLWDAEQSIAALMDAVLTANPDDLVGKGSNGTPIVKASIRHDAIVTHVGSDGNSDGTEHGPVQYDTTDSAGLAEGSTLSGGTEYQGTNKWNSAKGKWVPTFWAISGGGGGGSGGGGYYGDGVDGAVTISASNITSPFTGSITHLIDGATSAGYDTTVDGPFGDAGTGNVLVAIAFLRRNLYATTLSIPATVVIGGTTFPLVLCPGPWKIRASTSVTVDGRISNSGWAWQLHPDAPTVNGHGDSTGIGGGNPGAGACMYPQYQAVTDAGSGGGSTGTAGGGYSSPPTMDGRTAQQWNQFAALTPSSMQCGGGGGRGRFTSTADPGGYGGWGGLALFVAAPTISGSGSITSDGEKGSKYAVGAGSVAHQLTVFGGGGANPGPILLIGETISVTTSSTPGGAGSGTTTSGTAGKGAGFVAKFKPSTDVYS